VTNEEFLAEFGHLAEAPDGMDRLRGLILDLAVRGRLVPQDPADEPASRLLERIDAERERLVAEKKIKKGKPLTPVKEDHELHPIPGSWAWTRLGFPYEFLNGRAFKPEEWGDSGLRIIRIQNISDPDARASRFAGAVDPKHIIESGDLLLSWSATLRASIWTGGKAVLNQHIFRVDSVGGAVNTRFSQVALTALIQEMSRQAHGSAMQHVTKAALVQIPVAVPPSAEQQRIVARVDELMALCDELEEGQTKATELRAATTRSTLARIIDSGPAETDDAVALINDHLRLALNPGTGAAEVVTELRKAILDLAVRGRLVPQDPADEPASVLLDHIAEERERLVSEKVMSKQSPLAALDPAWAGVESPNGWERIRLGALVHLEYGKSLPKASRDPRGDVPVMGANGEMNRCHEALLDAPGIIVGRKGSAGAVTSVPVPFWPTDVTYFVRGVGGMPLEFVSILLRSQRLSSLAKGIKPGLDRNQVHELVVEVPPLAEQQRIVTRVDELMALCDELEEGFLAERRVAAEFADSAVSALVAQVS